jgi:hypothetical protein
MARWGTGVLLNCAHHETALRSRSGIMSDYTESPCGSATQQGPFPTVTPIDCAIADVSVGFVRGDTSAECETLSCSLSHCAAGGVHDPSLSAVWARKRLDKCAGPERGTHETFPAPLVHLLNAQRIDMRLGVQAP